MKCRLAVHQKHGNTIYNITSKKVLFHDISIERTVAIYRMTGDMRFGRKIVGVFIKKQ